VLSQAHLLQGGLWAWVGGGLVKSNDGYPTSSILKKENGFEMQVPD